MTDNIQIIETVADGLGDLLGDVVFIGGAVASLYRENPSANSIRPTDDVDFVVDISSYSRYDDFIEKLRTRGFKDDMSDKTAPICRLLYGSIKVDAMPSDESVLGFSNRWYDDGIKNSILHSLPSGKHIRIFSLPYYIASKIEAFHSRGDDFRLSHDIEDCIMIFDGLGDIRVFNDIPENLREYLRIEFRGFVNNDQFIEALTGSFSGTMKKEKAVRVINMLEKI